MIKKVKCPTIQDMVRRTNDHKVYHLYCQLNGERDFFGIYTGGAELRKVLARAKRTAPDGWQRQIRLTDQSRNSVYIHEF